MNCFIGQRADAVAYAAAASGGRMSWPLSWKCHVVLKIRLRQSMKNNRAKWNNDFMLIRSETTELLLGFFEERRPNKKQLE